MMSVEKLNYIKSLKHILMDFAEVVSTTEVTGVAIDSRKVEPGNLFLAYRGTNHNGLDYVNDAIEAGASAIVIDETEIFSIDCHSIEIFKVPNLRKNAGLIISKFYGNPSKNIEIVGVTGTNGKTTVSYILAYTMQKLKRKSAFIGTLGNGLFGQIETSKTTTPDAVKLHSLFSLWENEVDFVAMEVSSHALEQGRTEGTEFNTAIFTNLSRDHLDYHKTFDNYISAKFSLFEKKGLRNAVINVGDSYGARFVEKLPTDLNVFAYSVKKSNLQFYKRKKVSFIFCEQIEIDSFTAKIIKVQSPWGRSTIRVNLIGEFNIENILAAFTVLSLSGVPIEDAASVLSSFTGLPGRMEVFSSKDKPLIVVDYAHTPDALEKALSGLKPYCKGKLFCIFGCGGGRDVGKRSQMGSVAEALSDQIILTNDNPRYESPDQIFENILEGIKNKSKVIIKEDRSDALISAFIEANSDDVILLAGKGHEMTQQIDSITVPFSDRELAKRLTEGHS